MDNHYSKSEIILYALIILLICSLSYFQISNPYLWFDESGQFYMGMGLNHYSLPYADRGSLSDVLINNRNYNLDPGGFTFLVYFWSFIFKTAWGLRLLPFVFFLVSLFFFFKIVAFYIKDRYCSAVCLAIYVHFCSAFFIIGEFRAYSMEMCGTMVTTWLLVKYKDVFSCKYLILISVVLSFFCTSRYSFFLVSLAFCLRVMYQLYRNNGFVIFLVKSLVMGLPLLITAAFVYLSTTRFQNPGISTVSYVPYIGENLRLLYSPMSLLYYFNIYAAWRCKKQNCLSEIQILSLILSSVVFIMSIANLFPWDLKRALSATVMMLMSMLIYLINKFREWMSKKFVISTVPVAFAMVGFMMCYMLNNRTIDKTAIEFEQIDMSKIGSVFISYSSTPNIRYLYEYGKYKDQSLKDGYPEKFVFQNLKISKSKNDIIKSFDNPDVYNCDLYYNIENFDPAKFDLLDGFKHTYIRKY